MNVVAIKIERPSNDWAVWYFEPDANGMGWDTILSLESHPQRGNGIWTLLRDLVENQVVPRDFVRRDVWQEEPVGGGAVAPVDAPGDGEPA